MQSTVSERALLSRVNRRLAKQGQKLYRTAWDSRWFNELGRFYVVEGRMVVDRWIDLEDIAHEVEALRPHEIASVES